MSNDTTIYVGAYAIVRVPRKSRKVGTGTHCPDCDEVKGTPLHHNKFCGNCGKEMETFDIVKTSATTLFDLNEIGKLDVDKYHSISYSINHVDVDEPFISEPLLLVPNTDDGTGVTRFDPNDGDVYPWDVLISDIRPMDIEGCTANFIRLYFKELSSLGETTVHFGILRDVEV